MSSHRAPAIMTLAAVLVALVTASCSSGPSTGAAKASSSGTPSANSIKPEAVGKAVTVQVDPAAAFTVTLPGVATIQGAAGAVTSKGEITAQGLSGDSAQGADFQVAGKGVDVHLQGTSLAQDVTVTFSGVAFSSKDPGTVYAVLHQADDGTTDFRDAQRIGSDQLRFRTRSFSPNFPISLDLGKWFSDRFDSLADFVTGRTDPDPCRGGAPQWATLTSSTDMVHDCAISNPDSHGTARAEAQFKTNRRYWTLARIPRGAAYVWVRDQPDWLRTALANLAGENRDNYVLLPPGDGLFTAGYYRSQGNDSRITFTFGTDGLTQMLSLTEAILGKFDVGGKSLVAAAGLLVAKCKDEVPGLTGSLGGKAFDFVKCVTYQVVEQLSDPDKAFAAAMSLYGDAGYAQSASTALSRVKSSMQILGWVIKAAGVLNILRTEVNRVVDGVVAIIAPSSTTAAFLLSAPPPARTTSPPPATQPAPPATAPKPPTTPTSNPVPTPPPGPPPGPTNPSFTGGYVIDDAFFGGTWPRTDPNDGTWYSHSNRPANAASYWWANGLGVGFSCAAHAASYTVSFTDGHKETWNTWLRSTDTWGGRVTGLWVPSAVADKVYTDGIPPGMPTC